VQPYSSEATESFVHGLKRFRQEGQTIAQFDHENVVDVHSYFEENGTGYLVMAYYEGRSLAEHLRDHGGTLPEAEAVGIMMDVLEGLHAVHAEGILHRDIDPQNVYLTDDGDVILIDFGAAREAVGTQNRSLSVVLKESYAPIEQYSSSGNQGPWTDVYACAATLYECLTGETPPAVTDRMQDRDRRTVDPQDERPEVSLETSVAVRKGLTIDPDQRPASTGDFAELLRPTEGKEESTPVFSENPEQPFAGTESDSENAPPTNRRSASTAGRASGERSAGAGSEAATTLDVDEITRADGGLPALGLAVFGVGLAGAVGTALLLSDAEAMRVLAFFGTWLLVCGGLVGLFRQGEQLMSPEGRAAISTWLLQEHFAERAAGWPEAFGRLFDAVFTEDHLSWTCFRRSAVASVLVVAAGILGIYAFGNWAPGRALAQNNYLGVEGAVTVSGPAFAMMVGYVAMANVVMDYASLFQTRWVLGRMAETERTSLYVVYLLVDVLLTLALLVGFLVLFFAPFTVVVAELVTGDGFTSFAAWVDSFQRIVTGEVGKALSGQARPVSVIFASTFVTSMWIWLYMGASLLLRALRPILEGLEVLKRVIDVRNRPAAAMGLLLAVVVSVGFAISAPFVL
jgi:hypothetical protein